MFINKKFDRLKQSLGERMGSEVRTNVSDDFKVLEDEMGVRHQGTKDMHSSMATYVKAISKRVEGDNKKETVLPIALLGARMVKHGDKLKLKYDSGFGQCLGDFGRAQERLALLQESYAAAATSTWLESLERSQNQMKEYQDDRRTMEDHRLAYDASLTKMQKAKKEDFRVEETLRGDQITYEKTEEGVHRRMMEIKDTENESIAELAAFMDAQLEYHEECRQALMQLKNKWLATQQEPRTRSTRPAIRSRSNTVRSMISTQSPIEESPDLEIRAGGYSHRAVSSRFVETPVAEYGDTRRARPAIGRSTTYDSRAEPRRDMSPIGSERLIRVPSDSLMIQNARSNLRTAYVERDVFADDSTVYTNNSDASFGDRSFSSATSQGSGLGTPYTAGKKKAPPPPPPSRATKPPPPALPSKRTLIV